MKRILITLLGVLYVMPAIADFMDYDGRWGGHHMGYLGGFGMILPALLIIAVLYLIFQIGNKRDTFKSAKTIALSVLYERLAKGEIDTQTFNELKQTIEKPK